MRTGTTALVLLFGLVACAAEDPPATTGGGGSIAGTYECLQPGASAPDVVELGEDGTLTITHPDGFTEPPGAWSVDGDQGFFGTPDEGEPFTVVDGRLVFEDTTECSKTG